MTREGFPSSSPPAAQIYSYWKEFQLEDLRVQLDEKGLAIAERQEASVMSRKKLAETTKEFKRNASPDTAQHVGALLKSYQTEIDQLTARAKAGEAAFLDIYQKLYEAPDPVPALEHSLELASHSSELEAQVCKVSQELAEYKAESKELKNQDGTIRRLEESVRSLEAQVQEKDRQLEEAAVLVEGAGDLQAAQETASREEKLLASLTEAHSSLENLKRLHEGSQKQLFNMQSRSEEEQVGMQKELEIATAEMDRAQHRLVMLEREKENLKQQVNREANHSVASEASSRQNDAQLKAELSTQRDLVSRLHAELGTVSAKAEEDTNSWTAKCEGLRNALLAQELHTENLERELATRPSTRQVEELRGQVRLLQAVGFGSVEAEDGQPLEQGGPGAMEALLLEKTRNLEHQLTTSRLRLAEASGEAEQCSARVVELEGHVQEKNALIGRLEEDLLSTRTVSREEPLAQNGANHSADIPPEEGEDTGGKTMVAVLCGQRDRFRKRTNELEEEIDQIQREMKLVRRDLETAKADNFALVERLKYVQGYKARSQSQDIEAGHIENKYDKAYEEKMNPFSDWKQREKANRKKSLSMADRVMYEFGQIISSSQRARIFVVGYSVLLHLMVFWVIARWGHGPAHHLGGSELQLLCARQAHDDSGFWRAGDLVGMD